MKRLGLLVTVIVFLVGTFPAHAQDSGDRFTWTPYDFSLTLPDGWIASDTAARLVMGLPDDVRAVLDGNPPAGTIVEVRIVEPPPLDTDPNLVMYVPARRTDTVDMAFGNAAWPVLEIEPIGARRGMIVLVAETFLVTASAPVTEWDAAWSTISDLIANIQAAPVRLAPEVRLTQPVTWHGTSFWTPENWAMAYWDNEAVLTTHANRQRVSATFAQHDLLVAMYDYSAIRHLLTPESLFVLRAIWYVPEEYEFGALESLDIPGYEAISAPFSATNDDGEIVSAGRAILLFTPESAYLCVGMAGPTQWESSERALFEAIVATLERYER